MSESSFQDILFQKQDGIARVTINRPEKYNCFRTDTVRELAQAFEDAGNDPRTGVIILAGAGKKAFCTGGDAKDAGPSGAGYNPELLTWIEKLHSLIRTVPKPVVASVRGYAVGGGNVLATLCDLTIASETAVFQQVGPKVGSYDAGFGAIQLVSAVGEKRAREIWYLCRPYNAAEALQMGLVNKVVPDERLEAETESWCREILEKSPTALKFLKASMTAITSQLAGLDKGYFHHLWLYYQSEEAIEGRKAFEEKRKPDFGKFRA
ncbi:MAG: enoyl-CoA hydratase/isomerase family protein [Chloroflexi bacterium]|nr:enoyl-CoA hydratase/isomerase family protein [Chloroflexota bacterium]